MKLFGDFLSNARSTGNILFRFEHIDGAPPSFLIQSEAEPKRDALPQGAKIKTFEIPDYEQGVPVAFRLSVNAIIRKATGGITPVGIDGVEGEAETMTPWLNRKLAPALTEVNILNHRREVLRDQGVPKKGARRGRRVIQVDTVDGVARVGDPDRLKELLSEGVGRARSYGCGLLTVKPIG